MQRLLAKAFIQIQTLKSSPFSKKHSIIIPSCFLTTFHYTKSVLFNINEKMDIFLCTVWTILSILAIIGSILPWLPWPQLSYIAVLLVQFFMDKPFSRWFIMIWWIFIIILIVTDYYLPILWTKKFGWTKRWNRWCIVWMLVWIFAWPAGIIIWPFWGALIGEYLNKNNFQTSIKPAFWAFIWFASGVLLKLIASIILFIYFCIGCYNHFFPTLDSFPVVENELTTLL